MAQTTENQKLREYELTVITSTQISDEENRKLHEKYESIFLADGGEIIKKNAWGARKLCFPIARQFRGHYMHYDFTAQHDHLKEAQRLMKIDDNVLRFLIVKIGENVDVDQRKAEIAKEEARLRAIKEAAN